MLTIFSNMSCAYSRGRKKDVTVSLSKCIYSLATGKLRLCFSGRLALWLMGHYILKVLKCTCICNGGGGGGGNPLAIAVFRNPPDFI